MSQPTTGIFLNQTVPAAPPGDQNVVFQTDNELPEQDVTAYPRRATATLCGTVKPDNITIGFVDDQSTIGVIGGTTSGGGTGGGGGTGSASGGALVVVVPSGAKDGSNTQYTIPAPVLAGNDPMYFRNGIKQRNLGQFAEFAVQGTQLTVNTSGSPPITWPLQPTDWHELHYVQGTPNSEGDGGGGVTPTGNPLLRGTSTGAGTGSNSFAIAFPTAAQVGDLVVACAGSGDTLSPSVPSGWTTADLQSGFQWNGMVISKVMTSGDIAAGSVAIPSGGVFWSFIAVAFIGATGGVREADVFDSSGTPIDPTFITTSGAVLTTDIGLYFGMLRGGSGVIPNIAIDRGTPTAAVTGTVGPAGANSQANLNVETPPGGSYSVGFTLTNGGAGTYLAVVIVKSS